MSIKFIGKVGFLGVWGWFVCFLIYKASSMYFSCLGMLGADFPISIEASPHSQYMEEAFL